jgi:hypothetical protein
MQLALILIASILSALIFDLVTVVRKVNNLIGLSKESLEVMKSPEFDDDRKQKLLLSISGKVFLSSIKLSGWMIVITAPFLAIHITEILTVGTTAFAERLGSLTGISLSLLGFLTYFGVKQIYARFGL